MIGVRSLANMPKGISKDFPDWPGHCDREHYIKTTSFDFGNPRDFGLDELVEERDRVYQTVFGRIHIVKAPDDQKPNIRAKL